jgi:hypothetical protein
MSTPQNAGVIGAYGSGTTSKTSILYVPLSAPVISGVVSSTVGLTQTFSFAARSVDVQTPVTFTVEATDFQPLVRQVGVTSASASFNWKTPGTKMIKVTAVNDLSTVVNTYTVEITGRPSGGGAGGLQLIYLPLTRAASISNQ